MAIKLGLEAKLYRLTTGTRATWGAADANGLHVGAAPANLDEVGNVRDVTIPMGGGSADVTTRLSAAAGVKANVPTLDDPEIDIPMIWDPTDADLLAFFKAKNLKQPIALA